MSAVTPELVKELRLRTGIAVGKCKEALVASGGDMEKAIAELRKSGMATAVKKQGRETREGIAVAAEEANAIALMEINAETDFVVKNQSFRDFAQEVVREAAKTKPASLEAFAAQKSSKDPKHSIDEVRAHLIQSLGENIQLRRLLMIDKKKSSSYGLYSHLGGQILCLVVIEGGEGEEQLARDIAMHVAAESPEFLSPEEMPEQVKEHEREIARGQVKGKPANIIDKIVEGKLQAFYQQSCLLYQKYVRDPEVTVAELVENKAKAIGKPLKLSRFLRWKVGED